MRYTSEGETAPMPLRSSILTIACVFFGVAFAPACTDEAASTEDLLPAETFIEVWTDLRLAASQRPGTLIAAGDREAILMSHGVTEEQLLRFAEVVGRDLEAMQNILFQIQNRVRERGGATPGDGGEPG